MQLTQNLLKEIGFEHGQKCKEKNRENGVKVGNCRGFRAPRDLKISAKTSVLMG